MNYSNGMFYDIIFTSKIIILKENKHVQSYHGNIHTNMHTLFYKNARWVQINNIFERHISGLLHTSKPKENE